MIVFDSEERKPLSHIIINLGGNPALGMFNNIFSPITFTFVKKYAKNIIHF
jgi:hypothetical protein